MSKSGAKSKFTDERVALLLKALKLGATHVLACKYAGISHETFYSWVKEKPEFSEAVKEAEGMAAVGWLAKIEKAASEGSWQAAAWKLERRYPQEYGRTVVEQTGADPLERLVAAIKGNACRLSNSD